MNKHILIAFAILLPFLAACEDSLSEPEESNAVVAAATEEKEISFRVSQFETTTIDYDDATTRATSAGDAVDYLSFVLFDSTDNTVAYQIDQVKDDMAEGETFGVVSLKVRLGSYKLLVIGNKSATNAGAMTINSLTEATTSGGKVTDTFSYYDEDLTVDADSYSTYSIVLNRVVSLFQLDVTDEPVEGAKTLTLTMTGGSNVLNPSTALGSGTVTQTSTFDLEDRTTWSFALYTFLPAESATVTVTATVTDSDGNVLIKHEFANITMEKNKKLIYQGDFFGDTDGWTIQVDNAWTSTTTVGY